MRVACKDASPRAARCVASRAWRPHARVLPMGQKVHCFSCILGTLAQFLRERSNTANRAAFYPSFMMFYVTKQTRTHKMMVVLTPGMCVQNNSQKRHF